MPSKMSLRFDSQTIVITGASQGLGQHYARYLGSHGANIVVHDSKDAVSDFQSARDDA